jgi:adenosylhomocysteine nucleosidase
MTFAVILISANAEWRIVREYYPQAVIEQSPFGEFFSYTLAGRAVVFLHGGWGKISAAASTQFAVDRWRPLLLVNLGTCGGFAGHIQRGAVLLVERTLVYDIIEQMGDPQAAIDHYSTSLDLSFLRQPYPQTVQRALLVSADRDICPPDIPLLVERFHASAADWESGAIAWVARRNAIPCLILRGVSDLVSAQGGEAYNAIEVFHNGTRLVMEPLLQALPDWLECSIIPG